jgi:preprotein translocase subunit SecE
VAELIAGMFRASRYKRNQGRIARQATFFAMLAVAVIGAWQLSGIAGNIMGRAFGERVDGQLVSSARAESVGRYVIPTAIGMLGAWAAFRIVNIPRFAEFLISVENEMNKVSWPSRAELYRASLVVIVVIFVLTAILLMYDLVLRAIIGWLLGTGGQ